MVGILCAAALRVDHSYCILHPNVCLETRQGRVVEADDHIVLINLSTVTLAKEVSTAANNSTSSTLIPGGKIRQRSLHKQQIASKFVIKLEVGFPADADTSKSQE